MTEQPEKCTEHHLMLKEKIELFEKRFDNLIKNCQDMHCFLFGGITQADGHFSFVDKVNMLYDDQQTNRKLLVSFVSIFGVLFISGLVGLGIQLHKIDINSEQLNTYLHQNQALEIRVARLETKQGV